MGILIISFVLLAIAKIHKIDEDELPIPKDTVYQVLFTLSFISLLIFTITIPALNYKNKVEHETKIKLNEVPCWWKK